MPQIDANFIQTGKVRYVFKDLPIDQLHPDAIRAHEAGRCAAAQDKFWKLHYLLFSAPGTHTRPLLEQRASEADLSMGTFRACLDSGRSTAEIHATVQEASDLGAQGTPAFFLGMRDPETNRYVSRARFPARSRTRCSSRHCGLWLENREVTPGEQTVPANRIISVVCFWRRWTRHR